MAISVKGKPAEVTLAAPDNSEPVISPISLNTPTTGVAGVRTGRTVARAATASAQSGVLGVKTEQKSSPEKEEKKVEKTDSEKKLTKVEDNLVPLADTPFEEGMNMAWLWFALLGAAVATGAGAFAYAKRRSKIAANDEKKYKK